MGTRNDHGTPFGDEVFVNVSLAQRHVRAILTVEDKWELLLVPDAENHKGSQPFWIGLHATHIDAFAQELFANEPSHMLIANPGDQRRLHAKPRCASRYVSRRATDIFFKTSHVLEPAADLSAIEVNGRTADGNQVKRF